MNVKMPRTGDLLRAHLHEMHGAPSTSSIDHRSLNSLRLFHAADHAPGFGPKWTAFTPHTHRGYADPTATRETA